MRLWGLARLRRRPAFARSYGEAGDDDDDDYSYRDENDFDSGDDSRLALSVS